MNFDDKQTQKFMTLTSYRNKLLRNNAWEYIAKEMDIDGK